MKRDFFQRFIQERITENEIIQTRGNLSETILLNAEVKVVAYKRLLQLECQSTSSESFMCKVEVEIDNETFIIYSDDKTQREQLIGTIKRMVYKRIRDFLEEGAFD